MTDYYPLSIVVHGVALNITVQSHVDQLCFGLIACRRAVPDVHELGAHVTRAMASLRALVAALPAPARRSRRRPTASDAREAVKPRAARRPRAQPAAPRKTPSRPAKLRVVASGACARAALRRRAGAGRSRRRRRASRAPLGRALRRRR